MACTGWYCNHNAGVEGSIGRGKFCCRREWGEAAANPAGAQDERLCKHYAAGMQCASSPACRCLVHSSMWALSIIPEAPSLAFLRCGERLAYVRLASLSVHTLQP